MKEKKGFWIAAAALAAALALTWGGAGENAGGLAAVLSQIDGAGRVSVYQGAGGASGVFGGESDRGGGVVVVAQGASDPAVALALADAACTALGLPPSRVSVQPMGR